MISKIFQKVSQNLLTIFQKAQYTYRKDKNVKLKKGNHGFLKFEEKTVSLKCTECGQDYEDTQTIVNGIQCYKFHICPKCQRKLVEAVFWEDQRS